MRTTLSSPRDKTIDHLETVARELWVFGLKQANAALFGGLLLGFMLMTVITHPHSNVPSRVFSTDGGEDCFKRG